LTDYRKIFKYKI